MLHISDPDFTEGMRAGHLCYQSVYEGSPVSDSEVTDIIVEAFTPQQRVNDAIEGKLFGNAYYAGFITGCIMDMGQEAYVQHIRISCAANLVEPLVAEFQLQLADILAAEVYDYGWSSRFQQGYVIVSWEGGVPVEFEHQLEADERLEGYTIYNVPANRNV